MMNIYKAREENKLDIINLYSAIHDAEENKQTSIGWLRDVYPTSKTVVDAIDRGDIFILEDNGLIVASAIINQEQVACYSDGNWTYEASDSDVMVLHTLVVDPRKKGKGYGTFFVKFYEEFAVEHNCHTLRMDTQEKNIVARKLYAKLGYHEANIVSVSDGFNGLLDLKLVLLEKRI